MLKIRWYLLGRQFIRNSRVVSIQEFLTCLRNIIVLAHKSTHYRPSIKQASAFHIAPANWLRILKFNYYVRHSKLPQSAHFPPLGGSDSLDGRKISPLSPQPHGSPTMGYRCPTIRVCSVKLIQSPSTCTNAK